jgi:triphosphoribosyl-dephospho-CoA synthase
VAKNAISFILLKPWYLALAERVHYQGVFMQCKVCVEIAELAIKSMNYEISATPKPGLVDRRNSGAHTDMDFFTFMSSISVLFDTFYNAALEGVKFKSHNYYELLDKLRPIGIIGEEKMYKATNGVNTHKGLIFSMGIIAAAAGNLFIEQDKKYFSADHICKRVRDITQGITNRELFNLKKDNNLTYGEKLFLSYGTIGIRGEVENGFRTVLDYGLPVIKAHTKEKKLNNVLVQVLLNLMAETDDSNVLGRHGPDALIYVKKSAKEALKLGGAFTTQGINYIKILDKKFIDKNISPGGSADLLAVTIMLYLLETMFR